MTDGPQLAMAILMLAALSLFAWEALWPGSSEALVPSLTLLAVALSFAASGYVAFVPNKWASSQTVGLGTLPSDEMVQAIMRGLFLSMAGLSLLMDGGEPKAPGADTRERHGLRLLAACGGILAISSANLLIVWIGLELYVLAEIFSQARTGLGQPTDTVPILGAAVVPFGLALLYVSTGTLEISTLNRFLWEHGGPRPVVLQAAAGLIIGGIGVCTGLLPPYGRPHPDDGGTLILGVALCLRLCLFGLGALAWEWSWTLILSSLIALIWGSVGALRADDTVTRFLRLAVSQRGFVLLPLALAFHKEGLTALLMAAAAYALAHAILHTSLRWLPRLATTSRPEEWLPGRVRGTPLVGLPLLVSLLSLAGVPATLGFRGRAHAFWVAQECGAPWLVVVGLVVSILCACIYLPASVALARGPRSVPTEIRIPLSVCTGMAVAATGIVVLGLYPLPLRNLSLWVTGR